jgi:hypothetical protein
VVLIILGVTDWYALGYVVHLVLYPLGKLCQSLARLEASKAKCAAGCGSIRAAEVAHDACLSVQHNTGRGVCVTFESSMHSMHLVYNDHVFQDRF